MGGSFLASSLSAVQVSAYRQMERDKMNKRLDEYLAVCSRLKVSLGVSSFHFINLLCLLPPVKFILCDQSMKSYKI